MRISAIVIIALGLAPFGVSDARAQEEGYEYRDRVTVESTVDDVMSRPEFRKLMDAPDEEEASNPIWLERVVDWLAGWFDSADRQESGSIAFGASYLAYGLAFVVVVAALAFIFKAVFDTAAERRLEVERNEARVIQAAAAPGETSPDEFWARALALAKSGNEKLAIRELLFGAMSSLERQGRIRYRRGLTNRDYLRAAPRETRKALQTLVVGFERVYFGRRVATAEGFQVCSEAYRSSFGSSGADEPASEVDAR